MTHPLPDKAFSLHTIVLGKTRSGKSSALRLIAERMLDQGRPVGVIDPKGDWWGLRANAAGTKAGYPVVVFGGAHADVPLAEHHGKALAEIVGTSNTPAILDARAMTVGERTRFFADFAETLLRRNKGPLHLVVDEAHLFAPQGRVADPQSAKMLHAANNLISLGRGIGLRVILITQRPAKLHKDSLTQVETLVAMRLIAPQDRRAVEDWIGEWADPKEGRELVASLPSLKTGQGWIWAPEIGVLKRATFPTIRTYDSGRAPQDDDRAGPVLASIDLPAIQARLGAVAAEAAANDPRALRAKIAELERQMREAAKVGIDTEALARAEALAFDRGHSAGASAAMAEAMKALEPLAATLRAAEKDLAERFRAILGGLATDRSRPAEPAPRMTTAPTRPVPIRPAGPTGSLPSGERKILIALAQYPQGRSKAQVAILTGYAVNGGGFSNYLSALRSRGWIVGGGENLRIADAGLAALGSFDPLPTGAELQRYWLGQLAKAERAALDVLIRAYPRGLTKVETAERAGYVANAGGFNNALSRLRTLELVTGRGELRASDNLFG